MHHVLPVHPDSKARVRDVVVSRGVICVCEGCVLTSYVDRADKNALSSAICYA